MLTGVLSISLFKKSDELGVKPCAVELGYIPFIAEYLVGGFVKPLALPHMQVCGTPPYGIILYGSVITKTVADYVFIVLVFAKLFILFIKPNVETALAFFKAVNVEVVYQDFGEDGSE